MAWNSVILSVGDGQQDTPTILTQSILAPPWVMISSPYQNLAIYGFHSTYSYCGYPSPSLRIGKIHFNSHFL